MGTPLVSVIVPVLNEEETIGSCLESLLAQDFPKSETEIFVVDNGSMDRSASIIQSYPVRYLFEPIQNRARARNRGLEKARGRFFAFIDGDCVAQPSWLRLLRDGFVHDRVGGCGGEFTFPWHGNWVEKAFYGEWGGRTWSHEALIRGRQWPSLPTLNAMYRSDLVRRMGFFDESLRCCGDLDLGWRVALSGYELRQVPAARVSHRGLTGLGEMWCRTQEEGVGLRQVFYKYTRFLPRSRLKGLLRMFYLLSVVGLQIARSLSYFLRQPGGPRGIAHFLYGFYFLALFSGWLHAGRPWGKRPWEIGTPILSERDLPELKPVIWWRNQTSRVVIYRSHRPQFWELNETASRMWCLLQEGRSFSEVVSNIASEFEVSEERVKEDLQYWMDLLREEHLFEERVAPCQ